MNEKLYLTQEDLYRFGNSTSSRLTKVRPTEIDTMEINGILTVIANNKGVSLFNKEGLDKTHLTGWVWEISKSTTLPAGLKLFKDTSSGASPGHFMLVPSRNMTLSEYIGLLETVAIKCRKLLKKQV